MLNVLPKVFHRIWLGKKPMPEMYERWGKTWTNLNPGWSMMTWTEENLVSRYPDILARCCHLSQQSNVHRYEVLEREGGIYIDTDFECLRCLEPLLIGVTAFAGYKKTGGRIMSGILGATPHHRWLRSLVDDIPTMDPMQSLSLGSKYAHEHAMRYPDDVKRFPPEIFCPITSREVHLANLPHPEAYAIHHCGAVIHPTGFVPLHPCD